MNGYIVLRPPLSFLLLLLLVAAIPAQAIEWQTAERLTFNAVEDRTTSGSLFYLSLTVSVVWMQEQTGPGWRLMSSDLDDFGDWTPPAPVDPSGQYPDFAPRLSGIDGQSGRIRHLVWQRGSGTAAEILYASGVLGGSWTIEPITSNTTEDVTPDIADAELTSDGALHVVWAGYDPISGSGKIFYAVGQDGPWQVERLAASELGPFWTEANPRVTAGYAGIVHVVFRGGNVGNYHAHYARKEKGQWTYQVLVSANANDFLADVATDGFDPTVAMSGNDALGLPSHIYVRNSTDGGLTFAPPTLVSGAFSAVLDNITKAAHGTHVVGSEVSGSTYTGNLIVSNAYDPPEYLPPANQASEAPCIENAKWIALNPGYTVCAYTNHGGGGPDSSEVYVLSTQPPGGVEDGQSAAVARSVVLRVMPNPTPGAARIVATTLTDTDAPFAPLLIYDTMGRLVRKLGTGPDRVGRYAHFTWDARSADGAPVATGTYFLLLEGTSRATTHLTVVR